MMCLIFSMRKVLLFLGALIILSSFVSAECVVPTEGMVITEDTVFCEGEYELSNGIEIDADNITLDCNGAILIGNKTPWNVGIEARLVDELVIQNCFVRNYTMGIDFEYSNNDFLFNNDLEDNTYGIHIDKGSYNSVYDNVLSNNRNGISLVRGEYNSVVNNNLSGHKQQAISLNLDNNNSLVAGNSLFDNYIGILISRSSNVSIKENDLEENKYGIQIARDTIENDVSFNYLFSNVYGIRINGDNNIISNNYFDGNNYGNSGTLSGRGITVDSNFNEIKDNIFVNHVSMSISVMGVNSHDNLILNNTIDGSQRECMMITGDNQSIIDNTIKNCAWQGLYPTFNNSLVKGNIFSNSREGVRSWVQMSDNIFTENTFMNNSRYAIIMYGYQGRISKNNTFFLNKFIDSGIKHVYYSSDVIDNRWNITDVGNCWDDFELNQGHPDYYVVSDAEDGIDWHPLACFDEDNDSIPDSEDLCPNTENEQIIYGCSCNQILELKPGNDSNGECSEGIIHVFTEGIGWAKDLF